MIRQSETGFRFFGPLTICKYINLIFNSTFCERLNLVPNAELSQRCLHTLYINDWIPNHLDHFRSVLSSFCR